MRHPNAAPSARRAGARSLRTALACAIAVSLSSVAAHAQEPPPSASAPGSANAATTLDQVQVTGIRGSIQSSIKRSATTR